MATLAQFEAAYRSASKGPKGDREVLSKLGISRDEGMRLAAQSRTRLGLGPNGGNLRSALKAESRSKSGGGARSAGKTAAAGRSAAPAAAASSAGS